ncbi:hypothetical protein PAHAL_5G234000 [Panicum hallii]|jgi:hypothetical protein|uniref:DUF4408 domain-containing protein n=1 Tax=Panicum hallii TaxID=206008 RepID=A0A2S3HTM8_9POAL|nr:uncharacterized protein LOC112892459 [Panicum hallii]PAN29556.1 hypothetical protein PAHAL_5G234000 [Panicum hallii]
MASSDAGGAAPRLAWRVVRAAKLLVLAVGVYGCFLQLPCAAASASAVLRVAASLSAQQYLFLVGNAIVIVLFAHFRRDDEAPSFSPGAFFSRWWPSEADAQDRYLPFPGAQLVPPPSPTTEAGEEEVFVDKKAVHVTTVRAKPPRRSRSEKASGGESGRVRAAAPELRRRESENGRQQQQAEAEAEAAQVEWAMHDPEAFQLWIDAFILKQQQDFLREESAASAATAAGKKGAPVAAGPVVAVK